MSRLRFLLWLVPVVVTACGAPAPAVPDILLFRGRGTSPNDVAAIETILRDRRASYSTVTSERLDAMSESELKAYALLIMPGGNFEEIGNALTVETTARLRRAISGGLSYLGICAGAFVAGASPYNGLNLTSGVRFPFYAIEGQGIRRAPVTITTADGWCLPAFTPRRPRAGVATWPSRPRPVRARPMRPVSSTRPCIARLCRATDTSLRRPPTASCHSADINCRCARPSPTLMTRCYRHDS